MTKTKKIALAIVIALLLVLTIVLVGTFITSAMDDTPNLAELRSEQAVYDAQLYQLRKEYTILEEEREAISRKMMQIAEQGREVRGDGRDPHEDAG